jgi:uncharacterized protein (TIGR00661 family)
MSAKNILYFAGIMKVKVFLSDEGYGHIVRQSVILEEITRLLGKRPLVELQTKKHLLFAKTLIDSEYYTEVFNNITWQKTPNGEPDLLSIKKYYDKYLDLSAKFVDGHSWQFNADFVISDFVYEAFCLAKNAGIPSFGVAHFTWDWFFCKLYPPVVRAEVVNAMMDWAALADRLYFPYFTPREILKYYGNKAVEVPLIVRKRAVSGNRNSFQNFNILLIDSGSAVNTYALVEIITKVKSNTEFQFFVSETLSNGGDSIHLIPKDDLLADYIANVDLVVGRAGFNTITECIAYRTPMLLFGEDLNPEMRENSVFVKEAGIGSFTSIKALKEDPLRVISDFVEGEYEIVKRNMKDHQIRTDGAEVVAADMLNYLNDYASALL